MTYFYQQSVVNSEIIQLEHMDTTPNESRTAGDNFAHAPGRICKKCDHPIEARQPARRKGETGWVHDACPVAADRSHSTW